MSLSLASLLLRNVLHATDYMFLSRMGQSILVQFCHITYMLTFVLSVTRFFFLVNALYVIGLCFNCYSRVSVCVSSCCLLRATIPRKYVSHLNSFCCVYVELIFKSGRNFTHISKQACGMYCGHIVGDQNKM